ncbi:MAG: flavodoxin family protein [Candidatus Wallbacteria bacterium]|nr:flavodoxin family protein [Candidatus Wallbacteria bacterium]
MKVIAFNGSARKNGNTTLLIRRVFIELEKEGISTELIELSGELIHPCRACSMCGKNKNGKCVNTDDGINKYIGMMREADGIILGSPVYFSDVTSTMKAFIDRTGYVSRSNGGLYTRKIGAAVTAVRRAGATHAFSSLNFFFFINEMIVPGSSYWNLGIGRAIGEVEKDEEGMKTMENLGLNMAWLLKKIHV